jgi:hypothetical protein
MTKQRIERALENKERNEGAIFRRVYNAMSVGMVMLAFASPVENATKSKEISNLTNPKATIKSLDRPKSWLEMQIDKSEGTARRNYQWPQLRTTFFEGIDEKGNLKFNVWSMIAALQAEIPYLDKKEGKINIEIPFEYARLFAEDEKSGKPTHSEDFKVMAEFVNQDLQNQIAEVLYGWDWSKRVYESSRSEIPKNSKITSIEIIGTSSPEGSAPKSIKPDNVDQKNLGLAFSRANAGLSLSKEWLERSGVNLKQLEAAVVKLQAKEIQFTETELLNLENYAQKMPGNDDMERIYNLIRNYNRGTIEDKNIIDRLDQLVGSKRRVEITINYEKNEKKRVLIPIPLLPIIIGISLPCLIRKRRVESEMKNISNLLRETSLPSESSPEFKNMRERTIIDDLGMFFDRKEIIERGLDYRKLTEGMSRRFRYFSTKEEKELFFANEILAAWKRHDLQCRKEAGFSDAHLQDGLDYENQPMQINWARIHARVLLEIIEGNQKSGKDYKEILNEKISEILKQKGER